MAAVDEGDQPVSAQGQGVEPRVAGNVGDYRDVGAMFQQPAQQGVGIAGDQRQPDAGIAPPESRQRPDDMVGRVGADPQMAVLQPARGGEQRLSLALEAEQPAGHLEQPAAEFGRHHLAAASLEQPHAIGRLERAHLGRQRRLADIEGLGGAGEAAFRGDRVEGPQMRMIHSYSLCII